MTFFFLQILTNLIVMITLNISFNHQQLKKAKSNC